MAKAIVAIINREGINKKKVKYAIKKHKKGITFKTEGQ